MACSAKEMSERIVGQFGRGALEEWVAAHPLGGVIRLVHLIARQKVDRCGAIVFRVDVEIVGNLSCMNRGRFFAVAVVVPVVVAIANDVAVSVRVVVVETRGASEIGGDGSNVVLHDLGGGARGGEGGRVRRKGGLRIELQEPRVSHLSKQERARSLTLLSPLLLLRLLGYSARRLSTQGRRQSQDQKTARIWNHRRMTHCPS